jgi:hypothetical protein
MANSSNSKNGMIFLMKHQFSMLLTLAAATWQIPAL